MTRLIVGIWLFVFLVLAGNAHSANAPSVDYPKLDEIASTVAGRTIDAQCVDSYEPWQSELQSIGAPLTVFGYYRPSVPGVIRLGPQVCLGFRQGPGGSGFGAALNVIAHEASHARGVRSEATAACWGLLWPAELARRFYGVEFFTPQSSLVIAGSRQMHDGLLPLYREECR